MDQGFDSLAQGDVVVTRPRVLAANGKAHTPGWAPMLLVSHFRDDAGRRWAVATPLKPGHGPQSLAVGALPHQAPHTNLHVAPTARMEADADSYAFLPLFEGPAPFLRAPGRGTIAWGRLDNAFEARDVMARVTQAHARGVQGYRVGLHELDSQRAPVQPTRAIPPSSPASPTPKTHAIQETPSNAVSVPLPAPLRQAAALGAAKAAAHVAAVPPVDPGVIARARDAYRRPTPSQSSVSLTL